MTQELTMVMPETQATGQGRQADPYWYRQNASYLAGVTNAPSNPQIGIDNISLKPGTKKQAEYGILANGMLQTIIGTVSFQLRLSKSQAPFVQTISTENGVDANGNKRYWEHIVLSPQVKAQILRHYEALVYGMPIQQPMQQMQPQYGMPMQQYGMPMQQYGMPQMPYGVPQQQMQYGMPQQQFMPQQQMAPQQQRFQQIPATQPVEVPEGAQELKMEDLPM